MLEFSTAQPIGAPRRLAGTCAQPKSRGDSVQDRGHTYLSRWHCELSLCVIPAVNTAGKGDTVGATALQHAWRRLSQPLLGSLKVEG